MFLRRTIKQNLFTRSARPFSVYDNGMFPKVEVENAIVDMDGDG
jgi:hypothetical protein